jgi:hypothetical protein
MRYVLFILLMFITLPAIADGIELPPQLQQTTIDGADGLLKAFWAVVSEHRVVALICIVGMVATLIYTQYRKDFVDQGRKHWKAWLRIESGTVGAAVTGLGLWAFFHWGSSFPAGAEFVAGVILAPLTGFGTPIAYDLVLWRIIDRFMPPRPPASDGGGTP